MNENTPLPLTSTDARSTLPAIEDGLAASKRTVEQGGVRVFRRIVEIPLSGSISLAKEPVPLDRTAFTGAQLDSAGPSIMLTETAEEVVLSTTARVVEEVLVHKHSSNRVERIQDTVRHTVVDIQDLPAEATSPPLRT